jgi:hypothetical protein
MTTRHAIDVLYAWARLGLAPGADEAQIRQAATYARNYRFVTKQRLEQISRFTQFFMERSRFGTVEDSLKAVRKAYYKRAMELHPDRNPHDKKAEERLKEVNAAYELVEEIHKEAREHFDKSANERHAVERDASEQALREADAAGAATPEGPAQTYTYSYAHEPPRGEPRREASTAPVKYMAASVPRFIRAARLFYLGRDSIIGSRMVRSPGTHHGYVYDIIMLPEMEFKRARLRLSMEGYGLLELTMSKLTPPYIPIDTKEIIVPAGEADPAAFARLHFMAEFDLLHPTEPA